MPTLPGSFAVMGGADPFRYKSDGAGNALNNNMDLYGEINRQREQFGTAPIQQGVAPSYATGVPDYQPQQNLQTMPQNMGPAGGANFGMGAPTGYAPPAQAQPGGTGPAFGGGNPYLPMQGGAIAQTMSDNLNRNFMPQLGMASMAAGGYGSSAQGVLQANALKDMNMGLGSSLANLYGNDWTGQQNRALSRYQSDQGYDTQQRQLDQSGAALGASLVTQGQQGQWGPINNASNTYSPYTGLGTTTNSQNSGGGAMGMLGGALGAGQFASNMGWFGSKPTVTNNGVGNPNNMFNGVDVGGWWN